MKTKSTLLAGLLFLSVACSSPEADGLHERSRPVELTSGEILVSIRVNGEAGIYTVPGTGGHAQRLSFGADGVEPSRSADGSSISFVRTERDGSGTVVIGRADGSDLRAVAPPPQRALDAFPTFVGNDRLVFFRSTTQRTTSTFGSAWTNWSLQQVDLATGRLSRLSGAEYNEVTGLSSCGSSDTVLTGIWENGGYAVKSQSVTADPSTKSNQWPGAMAPSTLPDCESFIAVAKDVEQSSAYYDYELFRFSLQSTTGSVRLTKLSSYIASPAVARGSRQVLFLLDPERDHTYELFRLDLTTGESVRIPIQWN
jgi:hypothetical protein